MGDEYRVANESVAVRCPGEHLHGFTNEKATVNRFSSDRTVKEYANEI
jgi:hypothetical protein